MSVFMRVICWISDGMQVYLSRLLSSLCPPVLSLVKCRKAVMAWRLVPVMATWNHIPVAKKLVKRVTL